MRYAGRCHCGNIEVAFEPKRAASELELRECACSFCRRHGAAGASDPAGGLEITLRTPGEVSRYRFGLRTADFLVCRVCGVYVAAVCDIAGGTYGVLNVNVLEDRGVHGTRRPRSSPSTGGALMRLRSVRSGRGDHRRATPRRARGRVG